MSNIKSSTSILDRFFEKVLPAPLLTGDDAFRAKVLWVFSTTLGVLGLCILIGLAVVEGGVPARRIGTFILVSSLLAVPLLMKYSRTVTPVSWYVLVLSILIVFYVDFNNLSVAGPTTPLWMVPYTLMALLLSGWRLFAVFCVTFLLFIFNIVSLFQGWLPEPIVQSDSWLSVQSAYVLLAAIMLVICTRGMSNIADSHLIKLKKEVRNKRARIKLVNKLKGDAESAARSKSMFLATMSHELRTPLNSVIGNAQLLSRAGLPEHYRKQVSDIAKAGNLLLVLINDILDFSKLEESKLNLIEKPYELNQQLIELTRMMKIRLKDSVSMTLNLPDEPVYIYADESRLSQVLMNLLSNAIKFTEQGEVNVSLKVENDADIQIDITDTGIGIKKDDIDKLFTRFSQVANDSAKNMEGTGLGLAISLGIMKQMSGDIKVQSQPNKGSCFSITLPGKRIAGLVNDIDDDQDALPLVSLEDCPVLVVDDIVMNCAVLESMLYDLGGNQIHSVNSGRQALEYIRHNLDVRVIFMDMRMPEMDGIEATQHIRALGYQGIIIAVTANASDDDRAQCIKAGMDDFISKPVALDELQRVLSKELTSMDMISECK